jgi:GR25 family glycosyltransferase involved in LPS biosynthesis
MNQINFCINLDRRSDRWTSVQERFADNGLSVHRWSAINAKEYELTNHTGAVCSHIQIMYFCRLINIEYCLIFEDDVVLCHNFMQKLQDVLEEIPSDWEALSLHCFKAKTEKISGRLCRLLSPAFGAHGILVNSVGMNKILRNSNKVCIEELYFYSLDNFYAVNLENTMAFQTGEDSDIPETSIINEYKNFYDKYKHLHS